ncbi:MAG: response regulator [bacterium]
MAEETEKILIVDDEPSVIESLNMILETRNYDVAIAKSGEEAMQEVKKGDIGIVLTDLRMPGMDGVELLRQIKDFDKTVEVAIITAYASEESLSHAISLGAIEYLRKPFLMMQVYDIVERAIRKRRENKKPKKGTGPKDTTSIH